MTGYIKGLAAQILVYGGSTRNFVNPPAARKLKLAMEPSTRFSIMVGNMHALTCLGVIHDVPITIQGLFFH